VEKKKIRIQRNAVNDIKELRITRCWIGDKKKKRKGEKESNPEKRKEGRYLRDESVRISRPFTGKRGGWTTAALRSSGEIVILRRGGGKRKGKTRAWEKGGRGAHLTAFLAALRERRKGRIIPARKKKKEEKLGKKEEGTRFDRTASYRREEKKEGGSPEVQPAHSFLIEAGGKKKEGGLKLQSKERGESAIFSRISTVVRSEGRRERSSFSNQRGEKPGAGKGERSGFLTLRIFGGNLCSEKEGKG